MNDIWIYRYELRTLAALMDLLDDCGLLSHKSCQPNAFSEWISIVGSRLIPPSGNGIGFDDLLAALPWERLK